jgi:O-antigen ligase
MKIFIFFAVILFCGAILIPNHYQPWLTAYQDALAFMSLIFFGCSCAFNHSFKIIKGITFFFILIMFVIFIQYLFGRIYFFGDMFIVLLYLIGFIFSFAVGFNLTSRFGSKKIIFIVSIVFLFCSIISIYMMLKQWLLLHQGGIWIADLPPGGRPFANFAQPNNCATFLCMSAMSVLYLYEGNYINRVVGLFIAIFILFGIALTQSRTPWIFFSVFLIWWYWKTKCFQTRLNKNSYIYFLLIYVIFVISLPIFSNYLGVGFASDFIERVSSGYFRLPMWRQMLIAIQQEPWFGYGWNQVSVAQIMVYLQYPTIERIDHSHNILLDIIIWNGIPIGVFIIGYLSIWLYGFHKLVKNISTFVALSMVGAVMVHAMLEFPLDYAFFLLPVGFLLGVVQMEDSDLKVLEISKYILFIFLLFAITIYIWVLFEYNKIEKDVQLIRFESLNIGNVHANHDAPNVILLTHLREQIRLIRTRPVGNMTNEQLELMRKTTYRYATPIALYRYSQALALNNQEDSAKKYLIINSGLNGREYDWNSLYKVDESLVFKWKSSSISK